MLIPLDGRATDLGAEVGVFGGSGFYDFLTDAIDVEITTPYGPTAAPIAVGTLGGRRVAFLARHGRHHDYVGVRSIVAPCSVGSLQPDLHPGSFVVLDQVVDRTNGRADTFHDVGADDGTPGSGGPVHHQSFAEPYSNEVRAALIDAGRQLDGVIVHDAGTMVVINGPRFSTRAESIWFRQMGWHVVNMTGYPEAVLAAEAGIPYASVALVTDYDAGVDGHDPVTMDAVFAMVKQNVDHVRQLITAAIPAMPS
jgi:5'-methylthioadenosine phosphorylase